MTTNIITLMTLNKENFLRRVHSVARALICTAVSDTAYGCLGRGKRLGEGGGGGGGGCVDSNCPGNFESTSPQLA